MLSGKLLCETVKSKSVVSPVEEELTEKEFCKMYSGFHGEEIDAVAQLRQATFSGEELMEFVAHCLKVTRKS